MESVRGALRSRIACKHRDRPDEQIPDAGSSMPSALTHSHTLGLPLGWMPVSTGSGRVRRAAASGMLTHVLGVPARLTCCGETFRTQFQNWKSWKQPPRSRCYEHVSALVTRMRGKPAWWARYGVAALAVAAVFTIAKTFPGFLEARGTAQLLMSLSVLVAAWYGGIGSGLFAGAAILCLTWPAEPTRPTCFASWYSRFNASSAAY